MRNATGYGTWTGPGVNDEADSFTCVHCNSVVFVKPFQSAADAGGWCMNCAKPICMACADQGQCTPFLRKIEQEEARDRLHRQICGVQS
jgi:hypothetical protein